MLRKSQPIPIKWYLASLVGALCLALVLMTTFEILGRGNPRVVSKLNGLSLEDDHIVSSTNVDDDALKSHPSKESPPAVPRSSPNQETAIPAKSKFDPQNDKGVVTRQIPASAPPPQSVSASQSQQVTTKDSPQPEPSLWSLLISPTIILAAATIVAVGIAVLVRNAILARRQQIG